MRALISRGGDEEGTKTITIDPITHLEGQGKIRILNGL